MRWAVALIVAASALLALVAMPRSAPVALRSSCIPCTSGAGCSAGCRSGAELPLKLARTQELALVKQAPARRRAMHERAHHSLRKQDEAMKHINKKLLRLSTHEGKGELGSVLNSAMGEVLPLRGKLPQGLDFALTGSIELSLVSKNSEFPDHPGLSKTSLPVEQVLRAEEAEVQLRRLAALQKESSINTAVDHLGSSDQQLFKLRATEFELALKQVRPRPRPRRSTPPQLARPRGRHVLLPSHVASAPLRAHQQYAARTPSIRVPTLHSPHCVRTAPLTFDKTNAISSRAEWDNDLSIPPAM